MSKYEVFLYGAATIAEVEAERDDPSISLEMLAAPQCVYIGLEYDYEVVRSIANEMLQEMHEDTDELTGSEDPYDSLPLNLGECVEVVGLKLVEDNPLIFEVWAHRWIDPESGEILFSVIVQRRSVLLPKQS